MPTNPRSASREQNRRSIRLPGYDYRQAGAYFITICTHDGAPLFGEIQGDEMRLNEAGRIVQATWDELPEHYSHVELDAWIVMPNHVHGIIMLVDSINVGAGLRPAPTPHGANRAGAAGAAPYTPAPTPAGNKRHPLSEIVRAFKSFSARRINEHRDTLGSPVWQRNYYEHVIRDETALHDIRQYIIHNPAKWTDDPDNPRNMIQRP